VLTYPATELILTLSAKYAPRVFRYLQGGYDNFQLDPAHFLSSLIVKSILSELGLVRKLGSHCLRDYCFIIAGHSERKGLLSTLKEYYAHVEENRIRSSTGPMPRMG